MKLFLRAAPAALLLASVSYAIEYRAQGSVTWADNISRTSYAPTQKDATVYQVSGAAVHARQLAPSITLIAAGEAELENVPKFDALNRFALGARGTMRFKLGLGPLVPVFDASAALSRHTFRESDRSGWKQELALSFSQRLTEIWRVGASASWTGFNGGHDTFDVQMRRYALETSINLTDRWRIGGGTALLSGQVAANAVGSVWSQALSGAFGAEIRDYYRSVPAKTTNTFGPSWVAYRVECEGTEWWGESSFALSDRASLVARHSVYWVENRADVYYNSSVTTLALLYRF